MGCGFLNCRELAENILTGVGGKENVVSVLNCATRLRIKLKNRDNADTAEIKRLGGVMGVVESLGRYQVVVGSRADKICAEFKKLIFYDEDRKKNKIFTKENLRAFEKYFRALFYIMLAICLLVMIGVVLAKLSNADTDNIPGYDIAEAMAGAAAVTVPFLILCGFIKRVSAKRKRKNKDIKADIIYAPLSGAVSELKDVKASVFSDEGFGKGAIINPETNLLIAPANGVVEGISVAGNAVMLSLDCGAEIIIQIGIDTENLNGRYFNIFVQEGDRVRMGEPLAEFDALGIRGEGYDLATAVVVANPEKFSEIKIAADYVPEQRPFLILDEAELPASAVDKRQKM